MTVSAAQIREARRLLRRSARWIARHSHVDYREVVQAQFDDEIANVNVAKLRAIQAALEAAGVEFIAENGGGVGVRLRKVQP